MQAKTAVLIVGHGSREPSGNAEFEEFVVHYQKRRPEFDVRHGYVELARPPLAFALDGLGRTAERVVVLPLFLFAAGHVKNDIPLALASVRPKFPKVRFEAAPALGVHPALAELVFERASSVLPLADGEAGRTAVVVVGRGASDPDANADFCKLVRLFAEGRGFSWVEPCFIGITRPLFPDTLEFVARARPERLLVVPYLLFNGTLVMKLHDQVKTFRERYPWIKTEVAPPLGIHPRLFEVVDERVEQTIIGRSPLPCDTCQYRTALPGLQENVGGLKALLWSLRHGFTHNQAAPHRHAHKVLRKHVLVCGNVDCVDRGSIPLVDAIRRRLKDAGREADIRVTKTSCMGRCGEGPTVAVYPDGIWYRGVREEDAKELVEDHLLGDRLVARLVDNIMQ